MALLGRGKNTAWIYMKGGQVPVAPIKDPTALEWNRVLNDVSDATVDVATGQHGECCSVYGKIGTWGHEIVMFRDGERVWEGPITNIKWRRGGVSIIAQDVLARSKRKATTARYVEVADQVVDQALLDIQDCFATNDPNVLAHVQVLGAGTGPANTRDVKVYGGYWYDQLQELSKAGLMWTVVGRRIILWPSTVNLGTTATLLPADHMSGEVEIEEDGMELATDTVAVNDEGLAGTNYTGVDPFYGQVEMLIASDGLTSAALNSVAAQHGELHRPAPLILNVPQGSVLSCDAPFGIDELVAGTTVPVKVDSGLCRTLLATQQLTNLKVTQNSDGEKVAVTVQPLSGVLT